MMIEFKKRIAVLTAVVLVVLTAVPVFADSVESSAYEDNEVTDAVETAGLIEIPGVGELLPVTSENFPDDSFRLYMTAALIKYGAGVEAAYGVNPMVSLNGIWYYSTIGIPAVTALSPDNRGIKDLTGIEYFTSLQQISVSGNELTTVDFSANKELVALDCSHNKLTSLNVSACTKLTGLNCSYNKLSSLDISACTELTGLNVMSNKLTSLDISNNKKLTAFACTFNAIPLLDFRGNTVLDPFDSNAFNVALQNGTLTIVCDPGSKFVEFCELYGIPYTYAALKRRPEVSGAAGDQVVMVKEKADLSLILTKLAGNDKIKKYELSAKEFAYIDRKGVLKGKKPGKVVVTALTEGGKSVTYPVTIEKAECREKKIKSVSLGEVLFAFDNIQGTEYAPDAFLSSDSEVADIDPVSGKIVIKGRGTAKITAMYGSGKNAAKISYKIKAEIPKLNKTKVYLKTGESFKLKLKNTKEKAVFISSDEAVAVVGNATGEITAVSKGTAKIYAVVNGMRFECVVIVV
ncbi:MAG: Ig-like domain-containing protein [Lachnospiraceae bacterium]|nr:Ig-like domain-containing protein [Lachnospiraceae bacterium]